MRPPKQKRIRAAARIRRDADITRQLVELFADTRLRELDRREAAQLDRAGTDWTDESW
jgi:hypothetical protein